MVVKGGLTVVEIFFKKCLTLSVDAMEISFKPETCCIASTANLLCYIELFGN